jgi:integrase
MTGHVIKRSGYWRVVLEFGEQAAQRCPKCRRRYWTEDDEPRTCPESHGELEDVVARRQEMLPEKFTRKTDAERFMHDTIRERERPDYVPPSDLSVGEYLRERWLPALGSEELAPSSVAIYTMHVGRIEPYIGAVPLQKLTRNDVSIMAARLASEPSARKTTPLSAATRAGLLVTLRRALGDAVSAGLLRTNPADDVKRPKVRRPDMHTWTAAELAAFLRATRDDRMGPLWHVLALTGLRRGEALGLSWSDVDFDRGRLMVQRQRALTTGYEVNERPTKSGKPRPVALDAYTVAALRRQAAIQAQDAQEWREAWTDSGHVFTREDGLPWHPDRVRVLFAEALKTTEAPRIRMHDLRHTWATLALRAGVHPKVVQERLGHANIKITLDTYTHCLPDLQEGAAELVASVVAAALEE